MKRIHGRVGGLLAIVAGALAVALLLAGLAFAGVKMESFPLFCEGGGPPRVIHFKAATIAVASSPRAGPRRPRSSLAAD